MMYGQSHDNVHIHLNFNVHFKNRFLELLWFSFRLRTAKYFEFPKSISHTKIELLTAILRKQVDIQEKPVINTQ